MSAIVDFYRGDAPDYLGRRFDDILAWNDVRLEMVHNYIQVLFPLSEESMFNSSAPLLDQETITAFRADDRAKANLGRAFERMLGFYGLHYDEATAQVVRADNFFIARQNWINPYNHNHRRITRILKCLTALGLGDRARAFFACLRDIYSEFGRDISAQTFAYWSDAVGQDAAC